MPREMIPEDEIERWVTVHGVRVPIRKGQSEKDIKDNVEKHMGMEPTYEDSLDYDDFVRKNLKKLKEVYEKHKHDDSDVDYVKEEWYKTRLAEEKKNIHELSNVDEAFDIINDAIPQRYRHMWFVEANSDIKPKLIDSMMMNPGTLNAALNVAYYNYRYQFERYSSLYDKWIPHEGVDQSRKMSFETWLHTPMQLWRGDRGQKEISNDIFRSYTPDKRVAAGFTLGDSGSSVGLVRDDFSNIDMSRMQSINIRPIDTFGSYSTNGELEYLVPKSQLRRK